MTLTTKSSAPTPVKRLSLTVRQRHAEMIARAEAVIEDETRPGVHAVGAGLYVQISKTGSKSWVLRWSRRPPQRRAEPPLPAKAHVMGLGSVKLVTSEKALAEAERYQVVIAAGGNPLDERTAIRAAEKIAVGKTFERCATEFITSKAPGWRSRRSLTQWTHSLATYVYPRLGDKNVATITRDDVLAVLVTLWAKRTETASRECGGIRGGAGCRDGRRFPRGRSQPGAVEGQSRQEVLDQAHGQASGVPALC